MIDKIREKKPLVHHITNWVTIYDCANMTRAFGALPVMAHAEEEAADMAGIASSLVLNIGTLTPDLVSSMIKAGRSANEKGAPVILDAVGVGATPLRHKEAMRLLDSVRVNVIKGNASEISRLAGEDVKTRGVEATEVEADLAEVAAKLANANDATVVITGRIDIVSDGERTARIDNGHELMGAVVGTGCMAASVIGSFCAVENDSFRAAVQALAHYGVAGEIAAKSSRGPGRFRESFYDAVYNLEEKQVLELSKIETS